jgi:hypothetical protein
MRRSPKLELTGPLAGRVNGNGDAGNGVNRSYCAVISAVSRSIELGLRRVHHLVIGDRQTLHRVFLRGHVEGDLHIPPGGGLHIEIVRAGRRIERYSHDGDRFRVVNDQYRVLCIRGACRIGGQRDHFDAAGYAGMGGNADTQQPEHEPAHTSGITRHRV